MRQKWKIKSLDSKFRLANESILICEEESEESVDCAIEADLKFKKEARSKCDCLPSCENLTYIVEKTKAGFTG